MTKISILIFAIVIITASACKKGASTIETGTKTYLVSTITTKTNDNTTTVSYTYDDQNRIVGANYSGIAVYKITYANDKTAQVERYNTSNVLAETLKYESTGTNTFKLTDVITGGISYIYVGEITQGMVTKLRTSGGAPLIDITLLYSYDAKGNLLKYQQLDGTSVTATVNFDYDTKKSPFSMVKAFDSSLYLDQFIQIYSAANNRTLSGTTKTVYTYNADGFPVSAVSTTATGTVQNIQFDYIIK